MFISQQFKWILIIFLTSIAVLWFFNDILLPFIIGAAIAYFLNPVADKLESMGMNRLVSTIAIFTVFLMGFAIFCLLLLPIIISELVSFIEHAPTIFLNIFKFLENKFEHLFNLEDTQGQIETIRSKIQSNAFNVLKSFYAIIIDTINSLLILLISPLVSVYLLLDWNKTVSKLDDLIPSKQKEKVRQICREINLTLSKFVRGQILVCAILALFYVIFLSVIGLNYSVVLGLIAGFMSFIPYVGAVIGGALALALAFYQFWPDPTWIVVVGLVFVSGQLIEGNYLTPKIIGDSVGLHPVWLLFALTFFGSIFGFLGLLVAVPLAAAVGVIVKFGLKEYKNSYLFNDAEKD